MASGLPWYADVALALGELGGTAHLSDIYVVVVRNREVRGDPLGAHDEWVRNALQQNSHGRGHNLFVHVGPPRSGLWALKPGAAVQAPREE
jgi:hypothetical protein